MSEVFLALGWSNLMVSGGLALVAWIVQRDGRSPFLAHLLWLLVLAKLVTPPLWGIGMVEVPWQSSEQIALEQQATALMEATMVQPPAGSEVLLSPLPTDVTLPTTPAATTADATPNPWSGLTSVLFGLWVCGSLLVFAVSAYRILNFQRLLHWGTQPAPAALQGQAAALAQRLGLQRTPRILLSEARLAPLVWCFAGRPRLVLPVHLLEELEPSQLDWVLAHEMTHIRRRDHLVRWLEWMACVAFWWNPVAWWARKNLRAYEEICCDAQVLRSFGADARAYAAALLQVAASLAPPDVRPPAVASAFTSGGELERRFHMILSKNPLTRISRRLQAVVLLGAVALLPLGIATAQEPDYKAVHQRLNQAVEAGELSAPQAKAMLEALKKKTSADKDAVGRRLRAAMDAGELSANQAKAMMRVLNQDNPLERNYYGGARVVRSYSVPTDGTAEGKEYAKLQSEQKFYLERLSKMEKREKAYRQEAAELKTRYSQVQEDTQRLLQHGLISQTDADLRLLEVKERLVQSEREQKETMEYLQLKERMQLMERNLQESRLRQAEVDALRAYSEILKLEIEKGEISDKDAQEILDAARDDAMEQRMKVYLEALEQEKKKAVLEQQLRDLDRALQEVEEIVEEPIQEIVEEPLEPLEPPMPPAPQQPVEDPWGNRR